MIIVEPPNKFIKTPNYEKFLIYLDVGISEDVNWQKELINYMSNNILKYVKKAEYIVIFNPRREPIKNELTEKEINEQINWEYENMHESDIFTILFDKKDDKLSFDLGVYLNYFYGIFNKNISDHFLICHKKGYEKKNELKTQVSLLTNNLIKPIEIDDISNYGDLILQKIKKTI